METAGPSASADTCPPSAEPASPPELVPWIPRLAWALVALGVLARLVRYLANRSLWRDEAALAVNIVERSFAGLLEPLDFDQVAPIGFLMLAKALVLVLGASEYVLRLVPLAAGLGALPLFYLTVREFLGRAEAAVALMLVAISEPLIFYSSEVKQYSSDVFCALAILWPGARLLCRGPSWRRALGLAAAGVLGMWMSIPAAYVLGGVAAALFLRALVRKRISEALTVVGISAACLASFALHYRLFLAPAQASNYLAESWEAFMAPVPRFDAPTLAWYRESALAVFNDPLGFPSTELAAAAFLIGTVALVRRRWLAALMLLVPLGLALLASMLGLMPFPVSDEHHLLERYYPFYGRLLLFTAPLFFAVMGCGLAVLLRFSTARCCYLGPIVAWLLVAMPVYQLVRNTLAPPRIQEARPLIAAIAERFQEGQRIYSQSFAGSVVLYYTRRAGLPEATGEFALRKAKQDTPKLTRHLDELTPGERFWLVTLHHPHWDSQAELADIQILVGRAAERVERLRFTNCEASLYTVRKKHRRGR
jgi:hypothetical protein